MGPDGPVVGRSAPGRGAWLCSVDCLSLATGRKGLDRALRRPVTSEALAALRIAFEGVISKVEELPTAGARSGLTVPMKG